MKRKIKQTESYENALQEIAKINNAKDIFADENTAKKYLEVFKELVCDEKDEESRKELEKIILHPDDSSFESITELFRFYKIESREYINPVEFVFKDDGKATVSFGLNAISMNVCIPAKEGLKTMSFRVIERTEHKSERILKILGKYSYICVHDKFHGYFMFDSNSLEKDPEI